MREFDHKILLKKQITNLTSDQFVQQQRLNGYNCSNKERHCKNDLISSVLDDFIQGLTEGPTHIGRTYTLHLTGLG
jgi:hypothetical protein